jgi:hypothetical protein
MDELRRQASEWLDHEDASQRVDRTQRLVWLAQKMPEPAILLFHGGWLTMQLFEEAKYCFVYGQYLATITMAFGWVERTLASLLYGAGDNAAKQKRVVLLLQEAQVRNWITETEALALDEARRVRNNVAHFRGPLHDESYEARSVESEVHPSEVAEQDAREVLDAAFNLLRRSAA